MNENNENITARNTFFGLRAEIVICLIITAAIILVYFRTITFGFIDFKDNIFVYENPFVRDVLSFHNIFRSFTYARDGFWVPITMISYMIDYTLFGPNPGWFHGINIVLHVANSLLLFFIFRALTGSLWRSAGIAMLFAVHPLNVESVAWITERMNLLSLFFMLGALLLYTMYIKHPSITCYFTVLLLFLLALLAKPTALVFPVLLLLLDFWPLGRFTAKTEYIRKKRSKKTLVERQIKPDILGIVIEKIPFIVLSALIGFIAQNISQFNGTVSSPDLLSIGQRLLNAFLLMAQYVIKVFLPFRLTAIASRSGDDISMMLVGGAVLFLAVVTVLVLREEKKSPSYTFGWFWFLCSFIIPFMALPMQKELMMDRTMYLPLIGLVVLIVWGTDILSGYWNQKENMVKVSLGIIIVITGLSWRQTQFWKDSIALYEHTIDVTRNNYRAYYQLGNILFFQDDFEGAFDRYHEALNINPDYFDANLSIGNALVLEGEYDDASEYYEKAAELKPDDPEVPTQIGIMYTIQNRFNEAISSFNKAKALDPNFEPAYLNMGYSFAMMGRTNEAIEQYNALLKINPYNGSAHRNIGDILTQQNRYEEAVTFYTNAISIDPYDTEARKSLALVLAQLDRVPEAIEQLRRVVEITPDDASALNNLGVYLYGLGRYEETAAVYERALKIMPDNPLLHQNYAAALRELGRTEEADAHLKEAEQGTQQNISP